jgi:hypothetical protein
MSDTITDLALYYRLLDLSRKERRRLIAELNQRGPQLEKENPTEGLELCRLLDAECAYGDYLLEHGPKP